MKMKKFALILGILLLLGFVAAKTFYAGDTVTYSIVCHNNEGVRDTACTYTNVSILDPDDTVSKAETSILAEVSDSDFPGLWRGVYTVPASPTAGLWTIYIALTNSNSTIGSTSLLFFVDTNIQAYQTNLTATQTAIQTAIQNNQTETLTAIKNNQTETLAAILGNATGVKEYVSGNFSALQTRLDANFSDVPGRTASLVATSPAVLSIDLSKSGEINQTYYRSDVGHILGTIAPDNDNSFATYYRKRVIFDLGSLPVNITGAWIIFWLEKENSPTGNITVLYNNITQYSYDVSTLTTSYQKFTIPIAKELITSSYVEIDFLGLISWTGTNDVNLGSGEEAAVNTYHSSDNSTYTHATYEALVGYTLQYYQKAIADQLNEESIIVEEDRQILPCPGRTILDTAMFRDYQGDDLDVTTLPRCKIVNISDDGTTASVSESAIKVTETSEHRIQMKILGNDTAVLQYGQPYSISCNETVVTTLGGNLVDIATIRFPVTMGSEAECKFLNDSILEQTTEIDIQLLNIGTNVNLTETEATALSRYNNITAQILGKGGSNITVSDLDSYCASQAEINTDHGTGPYNSTASITGLATFADIQAFNASLNTQHGATSWLTATGFETETTALSRHANLTAQILGKGGSNLTITDLDTYCDTKSDIWTFGSKNATATSVLDKTGYSLTTQDWTTDSDLVGIADNATLTNINTRLTAINESITTKITNTIAGLANLTAADVWAYATRTLTTFSFQVNVTSEVLSNIGNYIWNTQVPRTITGGNVTATVNLTQEDAKQVAFENWNMVLYTVSNYSFNATNRSVEYTANRTLIETHKKAAIAQPIVW